MFAELVKATEESVGQAQEALRLASARLSAGAGTQLEVLDSRVQVTQAESNRVQALYNYNVALAEFDRVTATEVVYSNELDEPRTREKTRTDAKPTPAPKPGPLELNHAGDRCRPHRWNARRTEPVSAPDPNQGFRQAVALSKLVDPRPTLENLARNTGQRRGRGVGRRPGRPA